jgi:hypothetical protein
MLSLMALAASTSALAADNRAIHKARVAHSLEAARAAMVRLDYHADKYCSVRCNRYEMDLSIAKRAMLNLENYAEHALSNDTVGKMDLKRIDHAITAANEAIARLDYYASRVDEKYRPRVSTDVTVVSRAMKILANYARLAPVA